MRFTTIFFDLDDTLYPGNNGLWDAIKTRMGQYMHERIGIPADEVAELRKHYFETYGTTLRGLIHHFDVNADDYLAYVHNLPIDQYVKPAPELRPILLSLPQQRWIFTNADIYHASRVIQTLGLEGCFSGIVDLRAMDFACKPEELAFRRALAIAGNSQPESCVMIDDTVANLLTAKRLGLTTVLMSLNGSKDQSVDYTIHNLLSLSQDIPKLWI